MERVGVIERVAVLAARLAGVDRGESYWRAENIGAEGHGLKVNGVYTRAIATEMINRVVKWNWSND